MKYSKELHELVSRSLEHGRLKDNPFSREIAALLDEIDRLTAELARRDDLIKRLKEDGDRLADGLRDFDGSRGWRICKFCGNELEFVAHSPSCTITLHRALMKELEKEATDD